MKKGPNTNLVCFLEIPESIICEGSEKAGNRRKTCLVGLLQLSSNPFPPWDIFPGTAGWRGDSSGCSQTPLKTLISDILPRMLRKDLDADLSEKICLSTSPCPLRLQCGSCLISPSLGTVPLPPGFMMRWLCNVFGTAEVLSWWLQLSPDVPTAV